MSPGNQSGDRCIARSRCAEHTAVQSYTQKGPSFRDLPPPQAVDTRPSRPQLVHIYPSPALPPAASARDWTDAQDSPSSAPSPPCSHADDDGLRGWAPARERRGRVLDVAAGTVPQGALALPPTASAVEARPSRRGSPRRAGSAGSLSRLRDGAVRRDSRRQTGSEHRAPRRPRELFRAGRLRAQAGGLCVAGTGRRIGPRRRSLFQNVPSLGRLPPPGRRGSAGDGELPAVTRQGVSRPVGLRRRGQPAVCAASGQTIAETPVKARPTTRVLIS